MGMKARTRPEISQSLVMMRQESETPICLRAPIPEGNERGYPDSRVLMALSSLQGLEGNLPGSVKYGPRFHFELL